MTPPMILLIVSLVVLIGCLFVSFCIAGLRVTTGWLTQGDKLQPEESKYPALDIVSTIAAVGFLTSLIWLFAVN